MEAKILPLIDFSKVKKKKVAKSEPVKKPEVNDLSDVVLEKKKPTKTDENKENISQGNISNEATEIGEEYTYDFLLQRIYNMIKKHNPDSSGERAEFKMPVPTINTIGKSRSAWMNFNDFVEKLNRPQEHLFQFVLGEIGCEGTIGGENQLLLKSKVTKDSIEKILKKYIYDYVQCPNCKSFKTKIKRDPSTRLQQIYCENCKTEKTIQHLKSSVKAGRK